MVDWRTIVAPILAIPLSVVISVLVAEFAVRRDWAYHRRPTDLDGWRGRSTREPGDGERSGVNAGVVAMTVFVLTFTLLILLLGFLLGR